MAKKNKGNVLIGQSGGPTAVINQSLVGVIESCTASDRAGRVLGALHGIQGLLDGRVIDLGVESKKTLEAVARTSGSALRSVRKKPTVEECARIFEKLAELDVHYFFYIGGNDSAETARILDDLAERAGYELSIFHVPKTIDNDLRVTDHCPGYPSAARFVALALIGDDEDNKSLPGVKIDVIMGRHAGWLTAACALARQREDDGPHLVYCPERIFSFDAFLSDVERTVARLGRCVVAISEGVHGTDGRTVLEANERDSHGNLQLSGTGALGDLLASKVKERLGPKARVRADTFGYMQRSFVGAVSDVDAKEARQVGREAAKAALRGKARSGSIAIVRNRGKEYSARYEVVELARVAKETRCLDARFLAGDNDVTRDFVEWLQPLVGKLPKRGRLSDTPI